MLCILNVGTVPTFTSSHNKNLTLCLLIWFVGQTRGGWGWSRKKVFRVYLVRKIIMNFHDILIPVCFLNILYFLEILQI